MAGSVPLLAGAVLVLAAGLVLTLGTILRLRRDRQEIRLALADSHARLDQATTAMKDTHAELESFAYTVAHDLRAPLRAIDGFSRALIEDFSDRLEPEAARLLGIVRRNAIRMGELMDDLLAFSRLSRQPLAKRPVEPAPIVRRILADGAGERAGREVEIVLGELPPCEADPNLLTQIYANLIGNALKYTRRTAAARIEISARRDRDGTVYYVADNGVGFDMAYAAKLFGVFQRLHRAEDYEGTGVGLAIVQRIVQRHGGKIWAEAHPGRGATFFFTMG